MHSAPQSCVRHQPSSCTLAIAHSSGAGALRRCVASCFKNACSKALIRPGQQPLTCVLLLQIQAGTGKLASQGSKALGTAQVRQDVSAIRQASLHRHCMTGTHLQRHASVRLMNVPEATEEAHNVCCGCAGTGHYQGRGGGSHTAPGAAAAGRLRSDHPSDHNTAPGTGAGAGPGARAGPGCREVHRGTKSHEAGGPPQAQGTPAAHQHCTLAPPCERGTPNAAPAGAGLSGNARVHQAPHVRRTPTCLTTHAAACT